MEIKGNNIFSTEDEQMSYFLKDRNLAYVNSISHPVHPKKSFYAKYGKRIIDLVIIIPVTVAISPLLLVLCICNMVNMGSPIFYRQTRTGYKGKPFDMIKFRSMKNATDKNGKQLPANQRLTKYGKFIRKLSLDELGNFFNIIKGEMSIIGPRAMPVFYRDRMSDRHNMRESVKPGLECPRMIDLTEEEVGEYHLQFENDIWYVENISLMTDIKMVIALVKMVMSSHKRAYHAGAGTFFDGYNDKGIGLSYRLAKIEYPDLSSVPPVKRE
ncbi:MAG: sugar transferase [Lachnospiraceae bacterium]|nr:sugar transferase [Lachnospiraceae bacterium]